MKFKISGGIYHEIQVRMTYNSNHMEGSTLTEEQTRRIFETQTIDVPSGTPIDDIIETSNHFRAIDYCIATAEDPLTATWMKYVHYLLKRGTLQESLDWFQVGEFKSRSNTVGGRITTPSALVPQAIHYLLADYQEVTSANLEDIVQFHADFERIHPFQDGNGRLGRLIAFKECLHHHILPFFIEDRKKHFYYRELQEWDDQRGFLLETCRDGQDNVQELIRMFDILD